MREVIPGHHLHAVDGAAVGATAEAGVIAVLDPYLGLPGAGAVTVMRGDQGVLATAGAPGVLPHQVQRKRSVAPHLTAVGAQGVPAPGIR